MFNNIQFKSIKLILLISSHSGFIYYIIWSKNVPPKLVFCMIEQSLKFPVNVMYRSQRRIQNPVEHLRFHLRYLKWFWICLWLFLWSLHFLPPNLLTIISSSSHMYLCKFTCNGFKFDIFDSSFPAPGSIWSCKEISLVKSSAI